MVEKSSKKFFSQFWVDYLLPVGLLLLIFSYLGMPWNMFLIHLLLNDHKSCSMKGIAVTNCIHREASVA